MRLSPSACAKRYGGVQATCDTVTVCLNETAIALGSRRTESVSSVTANEFMHLPRRYRNAQTRTCLRARPHRTCSMRAVSREPGIDADTRNDHGRNSVYGAPTADVAAHECVHSRSRPNVAHRHHRRTCRRCPSIAGRGLFIPGRHSSDWHADRRMCASRPRDRSSAVAGGRSPGCAGGRTGGARPVARAASRSRRSSGCGTSKPRCVTRSWRPLEATRFLNAHGPARTRRSDAAAIVKRESV
jgi:hypothetical protein